MVPSEGKSNRFRVLRTPTLPLLDEFKLQQAKWLQPHQKWRQQSLRQVSNTLGVLHILENELYRAPKQWSQAVKSIKEQEQHIVSLLAQKDFKQYVVLQEGNADGLASWSVRVLSLISKKIIWGLSENELGRLEQAKKRPSSSSLAEEVAAQILGAISKN